VCVRVDFIAVWVCVCMCVCLCSMTVRVSTVQSAPCINAYACGRWVLGVIHTGPMLDAAVGPIQPSVHTDHLFPVVSSQHSVQYMCMYMCNSFPVFLLSSWLRCSGTPPAAAQAETHSLPCTLFKSCNCNHTNRKICSTCHM